MRLVGTKVAVLNIAALVGLAVPVTDGLVPRLVFTGPPAAPRAAPAARTTGNLEVVVARAPAPDTLQQLCGFLVDPLSQSSVAPPTPELLHELYAVTGGTEATARAWCDRFLTSQLRTSAVAVVPAGF